MYSFSLPIHQIGLSSFWFWLACSLPEYSVLWLEKKSVSKLDRFSGRNQMQGIGEILAGTVRLAWSRTNQSIGSKKKLPLIIIIQPSHTIPVYLVGRWCVHITSTIELLMEVWHGINLAGAEWKCNTEKWKLRNQKWFTIQCIVVLIVRTIVLNKTEFQWVSFSSWSR